MYSASAPASWSCRRRRGGLLPSDGVTGPWRATSPTWPGYAVQAGPRSVAPLPKAGEWPPVPGTHCADLKKRASARLAWATWAAGRVRGRVLCWTLLRVPEVVPGRGLRGPTQSRSRPSAGARLAKRIRTLRTGCGSGIWRSLRPSSARRAILSPRRSVKWSTGAGSPPFEVTAASTRARLVERHNDCSSSARLPACPPPRFAFDVQLHWPREIAGIDDDGP